MIKHPILYALNKNGKIIVFECIVKDVSSPDPTDGVCWEIVTKTGQLGKKLTSKERLITKGKNLGRANQTTIEEQAKKDAQSLWNEKLNEGYKSDEHLSLKAVAEDIEFNGNESIEYKFEKLGITYNTDQYWRPLPMLAEKWKDKKGKAIYPALVQPKLNGLRAPIYYDKDLQKVVITSRGGQTYNVKHIEDELEPFLLMFQNIVLDGELYCHGKHLQEIQSAVTNDSKEAPLWLEYHIYDTISAKPQKTRNEDIRIYHRIIKHQYEGHHIHLVDTQEVNTEEEIDKWHNIYVGLGYEGAMYRDLTTPYMVSFRDSCLLKVKSFIDEEFIIVGCFMDETKGIESFVFILSNNIEGNNTTFEARPTGTLEEKQVWYYSINKLIGESVTVRFQERSKSGLPLQGHVVHLDSMCLMNILK